MLGAARFLKRLTFPSADTSRLPAASEPSPFTYRVGKFDLEFPPGHFLKLIQEEIPCYDRACNYVAREIANADPEGIIIDVGANVGDTAALFANQCQNRILCVEAHEGLLPYLRRNAKLIGDQVTVIDKFLRTASIQPAPRDLFMSLLDIIREYTKPGDRICLFKTDTDGYDCDILMENFDFLKAQNTCLYFEYIPYGAVSTYEKCSELIRRLEKENYSIIIFDNYGRLMFHIDREYAAIIEDLLNWTTFQCKIGPRHIYYFDIWALPPAQHDLFDRLRRISRSELEREFQITF